MTGCADGQPTTPATPQATVTVDDTTVGPLPATCERLRSYLTVRVDNAPGELTGVLDVGGVAPVAKWVKLRDLAGFTGDAWAGGVGDVDTRRAADGSYVLTGTAYGVYTARPDELAQTAPITVEARC